MYEIEDKIKIGLEAYYFSEQKLNDGATGKPYWIYGLMVEKLWESFSLFINFENFTDTRQTQFDTIYTGTISSPTFRDIYAPVDGFVINGGINNDHFASMLTFPHWMHPKIPHEMCNFPQSQWM